MNEYAIKTISNYISTYLKPDSPIADKDEFRSKSYARWAANEILYRLYDEELQVPSYIIPRSEKTAIEIIDNFIFEMEILLSIKYTQSFQVARDVAYGLKNALQENDLYD